MNKSTLIEILRDPLSSEADKDDAAIELGNHFEDEETIDTLIKVSNIGDIDEMIAASCGESLGHIWLRKAQIDYEKLACLKGIALTEALSLIKRQRLDWYEKFIEQTSGKK
ncbi:hypothetical protein [Cohnella panacarvi]|uniref:hypothetical protein n=1 Tax=Cohnella panacarvi TaxID=400776 RepID=UPI00047B2C95|nr:hypothetical protein [Cohnella panacarvi]